MNVAIHDNLAYSRTSHRPSTFSATRIAASIARTIGLWRSRIRDRQALATIDDRDLRDLRLSRWELEREVAKPFWRG